MTDLDAAVVEAAVDPLLVGLDAQHEAVAEQPLGLSDIVICCHNQCCRRSIGFTTGFHNH